MRRRVERDGDFDEELACAVGESHGVSIRLALGTVPRIDATLAGN